MRSSLIAPGLEMSPEGDSAVVTEESVLMLNLPQPIQRSPASRLGSCPSLCSSLLGAYLVLQLAEFGIKTCALTSHHQHGRAAQVLRSHGKQLSRAVLERGWVCPGTGSRCWTCRPGPELPGSWLCFVFVYFKCFKEILRCW